MKQLSQQQHRKLSETFQLGQKAMQLGAFNQAEKHFLDIIKINPDLIEAQASLAYVYAASKQHAKAASQLKLILKSNPNHAQTNFNLANSLYEQQLYDEAIKYYQLAIQLEPNFVNAHIHCGICYRMLKNYNEAIVCLQQALNLDKANARAFHVLGMVYVDIEDYNRALHCLESAAELAPKHAEFRVSFASVLEKASLDIEAGLQYHLACEIDPNYLDGFTLYGAYLLKHHRHDEALECFKRAELLAPQNLDVLDYLGNTYLGMSDTDAALKQFNATLQIEPKRVASLTGIEQVYQETGKLDAAMDVCDKIISINPSLPTGFLLKTRIKKSKSDDGLAEQLLKFVEQDDSSQENKIAINFALGKIYDDQNNYEQSFKFYAKGNALKNTAFEYNPEVDEAKFSELIKVFDL